MKPRIYTSLFPLLLLLFSTASCNAQVKSTGSKNDTHDRTPQRSTKLLKNYFITDYPEEFFFVQCGLQDKAGNMWFGTAGNGIYRYDGKSFINFTRKDGLCHNDILCCTEDKDGNIWFGTRNGLIIYKPSGQEPVKKDFASFLISVNVISNTTHQKLPYEYIPADNFVWSILQDREGTLWFGTGKGIYLHSKMYTTNNGAPLFTRFLDNDTLINKENLHLKDVSGMIQDTSGNIWFTSGYMNGEGICRFDGKSITSFKPDGVSTFRAAVKSKTGNLFFLNAFHGVYQYDGKTFTNFSKQIGLKNDTIVSLKEDSSGNLWLGANSDNMLNGGNGGVWQYNGQSLTHFTTKDGLSHNCVFTIIEDRNKNIWFGTRNTGLCRFNGRSFTNFSE